MIIKKIKRIDVEKDIQYDKCKKDNMCVLSKKSKMNTVITKMNVIESTHRKIITNNYHH